MAGITDIFKASALNKYYGGVKGETLAEALFPMSYNNDFDLNVLNGSENGVVEVIQFSNFDADILARDWGYRTHLKEGKEFFRERMSIPEKERMTLFQFLNSKDESLIQSYIAQLFDKFAGKTGFLASVRALVAYTVSQLLSTGKVTYIAENGGGRTADYKLANDLKETLAGTAVWSAATSNPLEDLNRWRETLESKGKKVEIALMNKNTFNKLKKHDTILKIISDVKLKPTKANILETIEEMTELKVLIWDEKISVNKVERNVFPDNVVTLIPNGTLGKAEYGPTPTKVDKLSGIASGRDIVDINGTYASLEVAPIQKHSTVTNVDIVIEAMVAPNPTIMDSMFIGTVG
jgi:hypothetical protein